MATRSYIGIEDQDGSVRIIYCHNDGYLEHNGRILLESYDTEEKVQALISLGNISSLGDTPDTCVAYSRDRGDGAIDTEPTLYDSLDECLSSMDWQRFCYIYTADGCWAWFPHDKVSQLKQLTEDDIALAAA